MHLHVCRLHRAARRDCCLCCSQHCSAGRGLELGANDDRPWCSRATLPTEGAPCLVAMGGLGWALLDCAPSLMLTTLPSVYVTLHGSAS